MLIFIACGDRKVLTAHNQTHIQTRTHTRAHTSTLLSPSFSFHFQLVASRDGRYARELRALFEQCESHVTRCSLCKGSGFICEVCRGPDILFPFQSSGIYRVRTHGGYVSVECVDMMAAVMWRVESRLTKDKEWAI